MGTEIPGRPPSLGRLYIARRVFARFWALRIIDSSAGLTLFSLLSAFPALVAIISIAGLLVRGEAAQQFILDVVVRVAGQAYDPIALEKVLDSLGELGHGWPLAFGLVLAFASATGYVAAFGRELNDIFETPEGRPLWRLYPSMFVLTVGLVLLVAIAIVLMVLSGPLAVATGRALGFEASAGRIWDLAKIPLILIIVMVISGLLNYFTPNVKPARFRLLSVGGAGAIVVWTMASLGFAYFVTHFGRFNLTYGTVAGLIILILWVWITNMSLLVAALVDAERLRLRQLQVGLPAEDEILLPQRSRTAIERADRWHEADVERARELRSYAATQGDPSPKKLRKALPGDEVREGFKLPDAHPAAAARDGYLRSDKD